MIVAALLANETDGEAVTPEQRLYAAVIMQAIYDATQTETDWEETAIDQARQAARVWLTRDSRDFRMVCDFAGFHADSILTECRKIKADNWKRPACLAEARRPQKFRMLRRAA